MFTNWPFTVRTYQPSAAHKHLLVLNYQDMLCGETHINFTNVFSGIKRCYYSLNMLYAQPNTTITLESMPLNSALSHYILHMQKLSPTTATAVPLHSLSILQAIVHMSLGIARVSKS